MKNKTGISIFLALLMIASTFAMTSIADEPPCYDSLEVVKEVWNGTAWVGEIEADVGDNVSFRITVTYYNISDPAYRHYAEQITVNDTLPDCLEYKAGSSDPFEPDVDGKTLFWDLGSTTLDHGESYVIRFNATVTDYTDPDGEYNVVLVKAYEHCTDTWLEADGSAKVIVAEPAYPGIDIDKMVWDPCAEEWVDDEATYHVCLYKLIEDDEFVTFKINITNTGNVDLDNVVLTDVLPDFLEYMGYGQEYVEPIGTLLEGESVEDTFDTRIIPEMLIFDDILQGENYANVTGEYDEEVYEAFDSVDVIVKKQLSVDKKVWDPDAGEWVDELESVTKGQTVKFQFMTTYYGCEGTIMDCMIAGDLLPTDCLDYKETTMVNVAGNILTPGTNQYPDIIPDYGNTTTICGEEVEIPDIINCPFGCQGDCQVIAWDFRSAEDFDLIDGETVIIEFETEVTQYCECVATNVDFALGWGCYVCDPCNYYADWGWANVSCEKPDNKFSKKVWDGNSWEDEASVFVGDEVRFKLEFEYYGNENIVEANLLDELPCILEYADNVDSTKNITIEVSEDLKNIWFNLSEDEIADSEKFIVKFNATVTGETGDCPECGGAINKAWLYTYVTCQQLPDEYYDEVTITSDDPPVNVMPCPPILTGDTSGKEGDELTFEAKLVDLDGDDVYYMFDFGDGSEGMVWHGPVSTGTTVSIDHVFSEEGTYEVKARAKDTNGNIGEYGNTLTVVIEEGEEPEPDVTISVGGFGMNQVTVDVINNLEGNLTDADYDISVNGGILGLVSAHENGTMNLTAGSNPIVVKWSKILPSFGRLNVAVNVTVPGYEESFIKEASGFIIGRFVFFL